MNEHSYEWISWCWHLWQKLTFDPFMKIDETTFMWVLHIMNQSWCEHDLNDSGQVFLKPSHEAMMAWGTFCEI
jgi:hypothetical protein